MHNYIILLMLLPIFNITCASSQMPAVDDPELTKRLNRINEILDKINVAPDEFLSYTCVASDVHTAKYFVAQETEIKFLIENPNISLALMFKRLDSKKMHRGAISLYFIVFGETKSIGSIPYITDYFATINEEEASYADSIGGTCSFALMAAMAITHPLNFMDPNRSIFDQRLDMANKLRQWYEEYRRYH